MERISGAEWEIMRVVWTLKYATSAEIINNLGHKTWNESTIKTLIGRLVNKGFLSVDKSRRPYIYEAAQEEMATMKQEVATLFNSFCAKKQGLVLQYLLQVTTLSKDDIFKLEQILKQREPSAPAKVECNCLKEGNCDEER